MTTHHHSHTRRRLPNHAVGSGEDEAARDDGTAAEVEPRRVLDGGDERVLSHRRHLPSTHDPGCGVRGRVGRCWGRSNRRCTRTRSARTNSGQHASHGSPPYTTVAAKAAMHCSHRTRTFSGNAPKVLGQRERHHRRAHQQQQQLTGRWHGSLEDDSFGLLVNGTGLWPAAGIVCYMCHAHVSTVALPRNQVGNLLHF